MTTLLALDVGTTMSNPTVLQDDTAKNRREPDWRRIPGWPQYEVSRFGEVRRIERNRGTYPGRQLKPHLNKVTGYYSICLSCKGLVKRVDIHRLVALAFLGPQPSPGHLVAHNDGIRTNNVVSNLRWATQRENLLDMHRHGNARVGSANPMAKLDTIDLAVIRILKDFGIPRSVIAAEFSVHKRTVFRVLATGAGRIEQ
jgi:hypothetical protein